MDKASIISSIVTETQQAIARGRHNSASKSPYKKSLSKVHAPSLKLVMNPTDKNILAWAEKVLLHKAGIPTSVFDDSVFAELRTTAKHLKNTKVYKAYQITDFLVDTVKFTLNHADEQLELLRKAISSAEEKSKLSNGQMTHNRIGVQQSMHDSLKPDNVKKQINTTGVV